MIEVSKIPSKEPEHSGNASLSLKDHEVNTLFGTDVSLAWMLWLSCLNLVALLFESCGSLAWVLWLSCLDCHVRLLEEKRSFWKQDFHS